MMWRLAVAVMFLATASQARGQPARAVDKEAARRMAEMATEALRKKQYAQAARYFKQAYRNWPRPEIQYNLALVYLEMGDQVASATHLRRYLKDASDKERATLPRRFKRLLGQVGVLMIRTPKAGLAVWVDGNLAGRGTVEVVVLPGRRAVEIREGDRILDRTVLSVSSGQVVRWAVTGAAWAVSGYRPPGPPSGPSDKKTRLARLHWGYFAAALGVAVAAGAAIACTGTKTNALRDDYDPDNPSPAIEKKFKRYKAATNALVGIAAAAGAAAVVLAVFTRWRREKESKPSSFLPTVRPDGLAFSF